MGTYLLTWNPKTWRWEDLPKIISEIKRKGFCLADWGCGNNRSIVKGERVFMLRQGEEPRGIVGAGWTESEAYEKIHWRKEKARAGRTTMYISVRWEQLLNSDSESILPREWLDKGILSRVHWNTQISGITIPAEAAEVLEKMWADFLRERGRRFSLFSRGSVQW